MKDYDLDDTRAGTACTFTGRGSSDKRARLVHALTVSGFAAIFVLATGATYFIAQTSSRPSPPPGGPAVTGVSIPGVSAPSAVDSHPLSDSQPTRSSAPPADRVGSGEAAQGPPPAQGAPASSIGHSGGAQHPLGQSLPPSRGVYTPRSTASPAIPASLSRFRVQSGSFVNRDNAVSLIMRLRGHGYAVTLIDGPLYRVWVGGDLDRTKAERLAANLQAMGFDAALIPR
jgi:cell division septation protein DedD